MCHFVIDFDGEFYHTLCGQKIARTPNLNTGIFGQVCHDCDLKGKTAWVTFK